MLVKGRQTGVRGMIDIHSHILPGLDDGARSYDEAFEMCCTAYQDGVETIVATPHVQPGIYQPEEKEIVERVRGLSLRLSEAGIGIRILSGADLRITPELMQELKERTDYTINRNRCYILLEAPHERIPPYTEETIFNLQINGITPIITHPERNAEVQENPNRIYDLVTKGVIVQVTAISLTGGFGSTVASTAMKLLEHDLAHVIASDAHSPNDRPPVLSGGVKVAEGIVGSEKAKRMVEEIPEEITRGNSIDLPEPKEIKQRRLFFFGL